MKTIKLVNPIMINNQEIDSLTYDSNEITSALFTEADVKKKQAAGIKNLSISPAVEFDFGLHLYMGFAAIIAVNPAYAFEDLERVKGKDIKPVMEIGKNFLLGVEEASHLSNSEKQSEHTPKHTEQV